MEIPVIKIIFLVWELFIGLIVIAYLIISGRSPIENKSKVVVFGAQLGMALLPIGTFIWVVLPVTIDTITASKPLEREVVVTSSSFHPPIPFFWRVRQSLRIEGDKGESYGLFFYPDRIWPGEQYKINYLPHSRYIVKIEKIE